MLSYLTTAMMMMLSQTLMSPGILDTGDQGSVLMATDACQLRYIHFECSTHVKQWRKHWH